MGRLRTFVKDDIPKVAQLHWQFLQSQKGPYPSGLEDYFQEVFFHNPWFDSSIESLVYEERQRGVVGFLGVVPRPMSMKGKPIQAAFGSGLVVHPESRSSLAGLSLLGAFMNGRQDLAMTDTANRSSQQIWVAMGGSASEVFGMRWARPLRPGLYALHAISRFGKGGFSHACGVLSKAIGSMVTRTPLASLHRPPEGITEEELEIDTLLHSCPADSSACYSLQPEYSRESLGWLLDFMSRMKAYGTLRKVALRGVTRQLIGWFIYYVKRGGIAHVVQVGAAKSRMKIVLDYLFCDALNRGAIGVHGWLEIRYAQELSEARCSFWGSIPLLFRARDPELARLVQHGDTFFSRLDGEWCLKYDGRGHGRPNVRLDLANGKESSSETPARLRPENSHLSQPPQAKAAK